MRERHILTDCIVVFSLYRLLLYLRRESVSSRASIRIRPWRTLTFLHPSTSYISRCILQIISIWLIITISSHKQDPVAFIHYFFRYYSIYLRPQSIPGFSAVTSQLAVLSVRCCKGAYLVDCHSYE